MARKSLGICLMLVVASSVIYEAQGHFLLKHYLRKSFPRKCNEFTPYANKGMIMLVTDLENGCPPTAEFKNFFTNFKSYMTFIESASATSKNVDVEMTTKAEGLFKSMSAMSGGKGEKSADAGGLKVAMISMGKTLVEQKKNAAIMTITQKKRLIVAMVKWTRMIATFVKTASEKKGKTINIASFGLDVDVNDKTLVSTSSTKSESSSSTKTEASSKTEASTSTKKKEAASGTADTSSKKKEAASGTADTSSKTKEASGSGNTSSKTKEGSATKTESAKGGAKESKKGASGTTFSDTTGAKSITPSGSPTASPSGSTSSSGKTIAKGSADAKGSAGVSESASSQTKESKSGSQASSSTSVKQVETETSKDAMTFIMELEKKYSAKAEFKAFFEKLKASMTAFSTISSKTAKDYVSVSKSASSKLSEAMALVGSRNVKSAKMKSNMEVCEQQLMKTLQELIDINSKIVNSKTVTSTQQTEIKQTITKWEKVTTQFVETAASSSSSSSKSEQSSGDNVKKD